jgi:hypothetical protein
MAGAAALLPLLAFGLTPHAAAGAATASFAPPQSRLLLTRTLHSPLADGREIISRRSYEVIIVADGLGWRVDGRLVDCAVTAPGALAALAELERSRPDEGLFPIRLNPQGIILPGNGPHQNGAREKAAALGLAVSQAKATDAETRAAAQRLLNQLPRQPVFTAWPEDLFHPQPGRRSDSRQISLPDGTNGEVIIDVDARLGGPDPGNSLISSLRRIITTRMGSSERALREEWTLTKAS